MVPAGTVAFMPSKLLPLVVLLALAPATARAQEPAPLVEMRITSPDGPLKPDRRYTWRVRIENVGQATAGTVMTVIRLPRTVRHVRGGKLSKDRRRVSFTTRDLAPGASKSWKLRLRVLRPGRVRLRGSTSWTP